MTYEMRRIRQLLDQKTTGFRSAMTLRKSALLFVIDGAR